jgi:hypothetical protein
MTRSFALLDLGLLQRRKLGLSPATQRTPAGETERARFLSSLATRTWPNAANSERHYGLFNVLRTRFFSTGFLRGAIIGPSRPS